MCRVEGFCVCRHRERNLHMPSPWKEFAYAWRKAFANAVGGRRLHVPGGRRLHTPRVPGWKEFAYGASF